MSNALSDLKEKYNALITRNKNAEIYLNKCTNKDFDRWYPSFELLTIELSTMIRQYKLLAGKPMSDNEVLNGF